jgi:hypothetical protein
MYEDDLDNNCKGKKIIFEKYIYIRKKFILDGPNGDQLRKNRGLPNSMSYIEGIGNYRKYLNYLCY